VTVKINHRHETHFFSNIRRPIFHHGPSTGERSRQFPRPVKRVGTRSSPASALVCAMHHTVRLPGKYGVFGHKPRASWRWSSCGRQYTGGRD
jgi:hypothetical protein